MDIDFYKRLEIVGSQIPCGKVATYGQLALLCGKPQNARQVGYALRSDKVSKQVPAHRIVSGHGNLSGAGAFITPDYQKNTLLQEGIVFSLEGRINLKEFQWYPSKEAALEFYRMFKDMGI